jgi:hypothetical protein
LERVSGSHTKLGAGRLRDHSIIKPSGPKTKLAASRFFDSRTERRGPETKLGASPLRECRTNKSRLLNKAKRSED